MESKIEIVKANLDLSGNEIKKKLREIYPEITNEEVENLILQVLKELNNKKRGLRVVNKEEKRSLKRKYEDDMER